MSKPLARPSARPSAGPSSAVRSPLLALLPYLSGERAGIVWTAAVGLLNNLALIALAVTGSYVVALAVVRQELAGPSWWIAGGALVLLRASLTWHEMDISHSIAYRVLAALRMALFDGFARGVPSRRRGQHSGKLAATAMGDVEKLEFFYAHTVAQLAGAVVLLAGGLMALFVVGPELALPLLLGMVALVAVTVPGLHRGSRLGAAVQEARAELSALVVDLLAGTREILGFGLQGHAQAQLADRTRAVDRLQGRLNAGLALAASLRELCVVGTVVAVFLAAASLPGLDPVWLPPLIAGTLTLLAPVAEAVATVTQLQPHRASAQRVLDGINLEAATPPGRGGTPGFGPHGVLRMDGALGVNGGPGVNGALGVEVQGVTFTHDGGRPALRDASLSVAPGEHVGISGASGAGKSTLIRLLARLWEPDSGRILLTDSHGNSVDVASVPDASLRKAVTVVEQDAPVFHGTVLENMRLAVPEASEAEVLEALALAGLPLSGERWSEDVRTVIGEQGVSLSGGERARFCLARALLIRPRVLILDEVTASLDAASERSLLEVVAGLFGRTTVITVSHRESTLAACDRRVELTTPLSSPVDPSRRPLSPHGDK